MVDMDSVLQSIAKHMTMTAIRIFDPQSRRLNLPSWQIPRTLLRLETSTTGCVKATTKPLGMGDAA